MKSKYLIAPTALAALLCAGMASAQSTTAPASGSGATGGAMAPKAPATTASRESKPAKDDKLARGDRKFIEDAAAHGMFEVQAAQLAATKASDAQVKSFAEQLVKDHTQANQGLQQIASKHQVDMPKELPRSQRNKLQDLQKKTGAEFDREFVKEVGVEAHEDDVKKFQKAAKDVKDPELKAWVDKTLPALQQHLASAQNLEKSVKEDGSRMGAGPAKQPARPAGDAAKQPAAPAKSGG
ncbi:DUF4142 domain-containing protein [Ramlibacter rhizophilus]|uniref:DUF4142 domain-containing protein n=1 Tax=Ramlibacter rhizophilus TaxID=1781167 RepID=A0A4Z0BYC6_9BURK|nr:DUF4142 domain-containing protein [Ramlibacter rhizophilus]TFZ04253.1 DUF4142 domain-containing protein [Ramlibacter rhizophilus]